MYFVPAGSKYQLYRHARGYLHFDELRDYKFFYEACLFKNVSVEEGSGSTFGFGHQRLVTYDVRRANQNDETGTAIVTTERPGPGIQSGETFTSKITLTDNENYAVVVHCWEDVNQRGWSLYSRQYTMETDTRRMIEEHVLGLGFDRDNVAFLEYGGCRLDEDYDDAEILDLTFHYEGEGEVPPPTFEEIRNFSSIVTGNTSNDKSKPNDKEQNLTTPKKKHSSESSDKKSSAKLTNKSSSSSSGKSSSGSKDKSSSTPKDKSSGSKDKSSSGQKDKSSENKSSKSVSKNKTSHPDKSTSDSKDKSLGSKSKDKSSSGSKDKSSESHNKSHPKHTSSQSNKSMKDKTSDSKHENDHDHPGKMDTQKSDKKNKGRSHSSTDHSSEEDSSEEKFGRGNRRFRSGGYRRFGNVGGGWKR